MNKISFVEDLVMDCLGPIVESLPYNIIIIIGGIVNLSFNTTFNNWVGISTIYIGMYGINRKLRQNWQR